MKNFKINIAGQILLAFVLGILLGIYLHYCNSNREWFINNLLLPAGNIFLHLIKMIIIPIIIPTLIIGIAGIGDVKELGRIGIKTILYFEMITTVAIIIGITLANLFHPGSGIDISKLNTVDISKYQNTMVEMQNHFNSLADIILSIVPANIISSMEKGEILSIIFFSILFGLGLSSLPTPHREPLITVLNSISETMFKVTNIVMYYAPIGVFVLISTTIANFGLSSLFLLMRLVLLVYFAVLFFTIVILGIVARICKLNIWTIILVLKDEIILAYSTASSESVLPNIIKKMEAYGTPASIASFVIPTGYSFNLDGSTLYQSIAAIFIAQLYCINLSLWQEIILVITLMIASKGVAGVPGISFIVLLTTLGSVGIPLEGLMFIAGIDRILDMARTTLNVIGNALAALVIANWEHKFDHEKALNYEYNELGRHN